jgi:molecular chaperone DnaK
VARLRIALAQINPTVGDLDGNVALIKAAYDDLQTKFQEVTTAAYKAAAASAGPAPEQEGEAASEPQAKKDDVVDAEFEVLDEDKKK